MLLLIFFAFIAGVVTILSPCVLPILPIALSGSVTGGKKRPLGVVTGFILSFTFFTLFLTTLVRATGISADSLRLVAVLVVGLFGLSLVIPTFGLFAEKLFSNVATLLPRQPYKEGFGGGFVVGISLGLVWTPCVGPILASIITLAASSQVGIGAVLITLSYATGTAIPLLAITAGGRQILAKHPALILNAARIQRIFGILMIATAVAIFNSWDRAFQSYILTTFPNYGANLTKLEDNKLVKQQLTNMKKPPTLGKAPELILGGTWFNLPENQAPPTIARLSGNVVLIDFWTYTCINCIRTLPYLKNWDAKYKDKGLIIIGVHTPEFEFEKNPDNVAAAIKDFGIQYVVMQDNDFATWNAYNNRYWPAKYLIDKNGNIRYTHFGEGAYDETEKIIQELLEEAGSRVSESIKNPTYQVYSRTPELYLGYGRIASFYSPERIQNDREAVYTASADRLPQSALAFGGKWTVSLERASPRKDAILLLHFNASEVYLVMRPHSLGSTAKINVMLDDREVTDAAGEDVTDGIVTINADRLYKLIKLPTPGIHILKLEFLDDNAELYAFTFG